MLALAFALHDARPRHPYPVAQRLVRVLGVVVTELMWLLPRPWLLMVIDVFVCCWIAQGWVMSEMLGVLL